MALANPRQPDRPPVVGFGQFYGAKSRQLRQGQHLLFNGPTQSGKTTLCRLLARLRSFVVVVGTKPRDASLVAYEAEGYTRIDHWPPTRADYRAGGWDRTQARFILWPKIKDRSDLRRHVDVYRACIDDVFVFGRWTLVVDEGLWVAGREGLGLGQPLADIAYGAASNEVSLYVLLQRPSGVPRIIWSSVSDAFIFHGGVTNDVRELASLGTYPPREVATVIQGLRGHQFLDLPIRGQADWSVSEVERAWL